LAAVYTSSGRQKRHLGVNAARIGLHACITFRNKIVSKSDKLLQMMTLRHNIISIADIRFSGVFGLL